METATARERLTALLDGHDLNDSVQVQKQRKSFFRSGSFGDYHYGRDEFDVDATLFATMCFMAPWAAKLALDMGGDLTRRSDPF